MLSSSMVEREKEQAESQLIIVVWMVVVHLVGLYTVLGLLIIIVHILQHDPADFYTGVMEIFE